MLAAIIAVSVVGLATPAIVRNGADVPTILSSKDEGPIVLPIVVVFVATMILVTWGSIAIIERRRPWPFAPRRRARNPYLRETVAALLAAFVVRLVTTNWWSSSGLLDLGNGRLAWVAIPAAVAAQFVAWLAAAGLTYVVAHLIVGRWNTRRFRADNAVHEHETAPHG